MAILTWHGVCCRKKKEKAEISLFPGLHSVEKLVTRGQRPKAEHKVLPREVLHQLPLLGQHVQCTLAWETDCVCVRGCSIGHEHMEDTEQKP